MSNFISFHFKASTKQQTKNGYTPLHVAAQRCQVDVARQILKAKADPNAESRNGFTPLHLAAQDGSVEMVKLLLDHKAKVNARAKVCRSLQINIQSD